MSLLKKCECGCGQEVRPGNRFVHGHNSRGTSNPKWRGGQTRHDGRYVLTLRREHPRANARGYVPEHILVAERSLGRHLRAPHEVHHVNERKDDNRPENLVVCQDRAYHLLLHVRAAALRATGNPDMRPCTICRRYGDPREMSPHRGRQGRRDRFYHKHCAAAYQRGRATRRN